MFSVFRLALTHLVPPVCAGCDRVGEWLCKNCEKSLRFGVPYVLDDMPFIPLYNYNKVARRLLRFYKDEEYTVYSRVFDYLINHHLQIDPFRVWSRYLLSFTDVLVYVVTSKHRYALFHRLAGQLAALVDARVTLCVFGSKPRQFHKTRADVTERFRVMFNTRWKLEQVADDVVLTNGSVLIFDDVVTTGATVRSVAYWLKEYYQVGRMCIVSLFHTPKLLARKY